MEDLFVGLKILCGLVRWWDYQIHYPFGS